MRCSITAGVRQIPIGRLVLRVAGYDDPALDGQSDAVCTALQLTNFWQDFAIDWRRGRLYLPQRSSRARLHRRRTSTARDDPGVARRCSTGDPSNARALRRGTPCLRCSARPSPLGAAFYLARRHADPRQHRSCRLRRAQSPPHPWRGGRALLGWRALRWRTASPAR